MTPLPMPAPLPLPLPLQTATPSSPATSPLILIVDNDAELSGQLHRLFAREGWVSHAVGSGAEAERWLALQRPALVFDDLRIDLPRREASVQGQVVPLTSVEFKILLALVSAGSAACSRELLAAAAQVSGYRPLDRTVDVQVGRLRRKLCAARPGPEWIVTLRGQGYAFEPGTATQGS